MKRSEAYRAIKEAERVLETDKVILNNKWSGNQELFLRIAGEDWDTRMTGQIGEVAEKVKEVGDYCIDENDRELSDMVMRVIEKARTLLNTCTREAYERRDASMSRYVQKLVKMVSAGDGGSELMYRREQEHGDVCRTAAAPSLPEAVGSKKAKQQQKSQPARGKGRPKETLKDRMINDADGSKLQKVHTVMNGKKGKDAALIILACIKKGWMSRPTFTQVAEEFGDIGTRQGFTKYINENLFDKDEIEGAINSLD